MIEVVDILVRGEQFTERYDTQRIRLDTGDYCLVESVIGIQMGKVIAPARVMKARCVDDKLPKVIRKASDSDIDILHRLEQLEYDARKFCIDRIAELNLEMKLVKVIFAFDKSKGLFMFTADGRVDFRELVRDLAHHFKTRIEMKQIGIRDEARILGGIGNCGCALCCVSFLRDFHPVSIKMAKDQGLSLIPSKISGLCGRLMCCLQYEHEHYSHQVKCMPKMGKRVMTPKGEGRVRQLNILRGLIMVDLVEGDMEEFTSCEVTPYHIYLEQKEKAEKEKADNAESADQADEKPEQEKHFEQEAKGPEQKSREARSRGQRPERLDRPQQDKRERASTERRGRSGQDRREKPQRDRRARQDSQQQDQRDRQQQDPRDGKSQEQREKFRKSRNRRRRPRRPQDQRSENRSENRSETRTERQSKSKPENKKKE